MTRSADRSFAVLVLLALTSSAILTTLLGTLLPHTDELFLRGTAGTADIVTVLVLLLAFGGIALGLLALFRQLIETVILIRSLLSRRIETPGHIVALAEELDLAGRVDVVDDRRPFSFCYWFLRPRICLATGLVDRLDAEELRAVLLHERYHLRHRDPLRLVIARYFAAGLYVVPVVEELLEHYTVQKEIAADQDAVRTSGGVRALASALYKVLPDADDVSLGLLVPVGSLSVTEARIDQLVDGRAVPLVLSRVGIALSGGALVAAMILALSQAGLHATIDPITPLAALLSFIGPASLLSIAAVTGGIQQLRLVAHR